MTKYDFCKPLKTLTKIKFRISPTNNENSNLEPAINPKFRSQLEEMFINWTTQIHEIVHEQTIENSTVSRSNSTTTTTAAATSPHYLQTIALPANEIAFWTNRKLNLQNIYEQLRSPSHKSLAHILQSIESPYEPPFVKVFKELIFAWHEAEDISLWLQPLLRQTAAFNAVNFNHSYELVEPLVHVVHLIWTNSQYYRSTQRMSVLLRCICNLLVHRAGEDLEFPILFQNDADEGLQKITKTMEVLELFK